jgi:hypothetical protein
LTHRRARAATTILATRRASSSVAAPHIPSGPDPFIFVEAEAAQILRVSPRTLQRWRKDGGGPPFVLLTESGSRIGYVAVELRNWVAERIVTSTSEASVRRQTIEAVGP